MDDIFFIDKDGNKIYSEEVASHIALANIIISKNASLREEYEKSKRNGYPTDFLIFEKGYLKVSNIAYYQKIVYSSAANLSEKQIRLIQYFRMDGYSAEDVSLVELKDRFKNK